MHSIYGALHHCILVFQNRERKDLSTFQEPMADLTPSLQKVLERWKDYFSSLLNENEEPTLVESLQDIPEGVLEPPDYE